MPLVNSKELFQKAYAGKYAIGGFNVNNMEILQGIVEAGNEEHSPLILQVSSGARKYASPVYLRKLVEAAVATSDIPIVLHLDHGESVEMCKACVDDGFTSVMIDASKFPFEKNIEITKLTKSIGIKSIVQLVIGSPSETQDTIDDTIQFLKDCEADEISVNYLLPFPETPIWEYIEKNNLIPDVEKYLDEVAEREGSQIINLTKVSDRIWRTWSFQITSEWKLHLMRNHPKYLIMYPLIKIMESTYRTIGYPTILKRII